MVDNATLLSCDAAGRVEDALAGVVRRHSNARAEAMLDAAIAHTLKAEKASTPPSGAVRQHRSRDYGPPTS